MKHTFSILATVTIIPILFSSCGTRSNYLYPLPYGQNVATTGSGGENTGVIIEDIHDSKNSLDLVPFGDRITYTIDYGTQEGRQKLQGLSINEAKELAAIEASRKYNCDSFIKQRFTYLLSKDKTCILRITIDGRPANYKTKSK